MRNPAVGLFPSDNIRAFAGGFTDDIPNLSIFPVMAQNPRIHRRIKVSVVSGNPNVWAEKVCCCRLILGSCRGQPAVPRAVATAPRRKRHYSILCLNSIDPGLIRAPESEQVHEVDGIPGTLLFEVPLSRDD